MWAMEYNPNIFCLYEEPGAATDKNAAPSLTNKLLKQCGKFERKNMKTGCTDQQSALAVFLVASVLETKNKRILKEAKGLDDVVEVISLPLSTCVLAYLHYLLKNMHMHIFRKDASWFVLQWTHSPDIGRYYWKLGC